MGGRDRGEVRGGGLDLEVRVGWYTYNPLILLLVFDLAIYPAFRHIAISTYYLRRLPKACTYYQAFFFHSLFLRRRIAFWFKEILLISQLIS